MMDEKNTVASGDRIRFECDLTDPPEKVWRALTVPEILAAWMMPNNIRPEVGSRFTFDDMQNHVPIECEILDAEPGKLLRYSWRERPQPGREAGDTGFDSTVTFVLARTDSGGTHLRVVHGDFAVATPAVVMAGAGCRLSLNATRTDNGWKSALAANAPCMLSRAA